jgi:hypothetical protein
MTPGRLGRVEPVLEMVPSGLFLEPGILSEQRKELGGLQPKPTGTARWKVKKPWVT